MTKFTYEVIGGIINYQNDNIDVFVKLDNGEEYVGSFFTYENFQDLIRKNKQTGELLNGRYFWSSDMIFIESLVSDNIRDVIEELLSDGSFYKAFSRIENEEL